MEKCWVADYGEIREAFLLRVCPNTGKNLVYFLDDYMKHGHPHPNEGYQGAIFSPFDVWVGTNYPPQRWAENLEVSHTPKQWGHDGLAQ